MKCTVGATIRVSEPSGQLTAWAKKTLIIVNPDYIRKVRMGRYLGKTPQKLKLYEMDGDDLILPYGTLRDVCAVCRDRTTDFGEVETVNFGGTDVPLYDYQQQAVDEMYYRQGFGILQSPAGSGKTQMAIALAKKYHRRTLWITHTIDLLNQSKERAERYMDPGKIGTITEGKVEIGEAMTFATVQTLCRIDLDKYARTWDVIICDECHRISGSPTMVTQYYKVLNHLAARHKFGLSATVHRSDGMIAATCALIGQVGYTVPDEAVADKVMTVTVRTVGTSCKLTNDCIGTDGMINYSGLITHLCEDEERTKLIVDTIVDNIGHSCLILSDRLEHLETMMKMLPEDMRYDAAIISGQMVSKKQKQLRQQYIEEMRQGKRLYLFATYGLAKEGLDIPRLDRLFLTTPHKDYAVITQSIGRIARTYDGKTDPEVIDFVDGAIPMLWSAYKKRNTVYKQNHCRYAED